VGTGVIIASAQYNLVSTYSTYDLGSVVASGTASGPVGSAFDFGISNGGEGGPDAVTFDCGGWTVQGSGANNMYCVNNGAGSDTISWTVKRTVFWCTSGCDPSPNLSNADDPVKHMFAQVTGSNELLQDVTCP
jgi:hypothetical protein